MKISFHIDDHADADEVGKLKALLAILEGGEPTSTVDDEKPAKGKGKNKSEEEPTDHESDEEATEPADDTPAEDTDEIDAETIAKLKDAGRKLLAKKGNDALKATLKKVGVTKISDIPADKADYALKLLVKAAA